MSTQAQIDANRRNAEHSTGPRTAEGKAASRMNALQSGIYAESEIIRGEDPDVLTALSARFNAHHQPQTPAEQSLVDILVSSEWQLRRFRRIEAQIWERQFQRDEKFGVHKKDTYLAEPYESSGDTLSRLRRNADAVQRNHRQTMKDLVALQAHRRQATLDQPVTEEIGSVSSTDPPPVPEPPAAAPPVPAPSLVSLPLLADRVVPIGPSPEPLRPNGRVPAKPLESA